MSTSVTPNGPLMLHGEGPVLAMGVHNALGARLAQEAGFQAVWVSGLELSAAAGVADANILSMRDFLETSRQIAQAVSIPVICDCDTGFGNAMNVMNLMGQYQAAGVAGICIEDKVFPKLNSFAQGKQKLLSRAAFAGKIEAAKHAQTRDDFMVIARTEALIVGAGLDEALLRATTYASAGADIVLIHSKAPNPDEICEFLERWDRETPIAVVPTTYPQLDADALHGRGAKLVIYANHGIRASIRAMTETFAQIFNQRSTLEAEKAIAPLSRIFALQDMETFLEYEKRFVRDEEETQS
ncbi:MAG: isocitrate lyase/phosphoenolpyruvate mutase family protein [Myxococcota bacterium]|nr:isocitrate lyase/phosphoenolpyruvate mutase family protein [Myxococcota bacterium]